MPLGPLPEDNTARGAILYTSGTLVHLAMFRLGAGATKADFATKGQALADLMVPLISTIDEVAGGVYWPEGSNISQTLDITPAGGTNGTTTVNDLSQSAFGAFEGRSVDGRKTRFTVFTLVQAIGTSTRRSITALGGPWEALWNEVVSATLPLTTISGEPAVWKSYLNEGRNARYQRKLR